jgi:hypothetical protein
MGGIGMIKLIDLDTKRYVIENENQDYIYLYENELENLYKELKVLMAFQTK